ncbi:protease prsW family protein [Gregarina niphandrodes]|uniref:Protease prsW family protein n=1 Tax=Gregarina niphandrodes TaxID=110365 RepID=A0A023AYX4_GRENI|nr:protease prsW family protein [Gregarina niphandrodes]EZG43861.1 protease prsW family protein [Gregarina niphandrodes]|eukprot:XP_011132949.1 protease prsW family protein [Gregarina niphandrodes]
MAVFPVCMILTLLKLQQELSTVTLLEYFVCGCTLSVATASVLETVAQVQTAPVLSCQGASWQCNVLFAVALTISVSLVEEFAKFLPVMFVRTSEDHLPARRGRWLFRALESPRAIVLAGCASAGGFATVENVKYVFGGEDVQEDFDTSLARAVLAIPFHIACTALVTAAWADELFYTPTALCCPTPPRPGAWQLIRNNLQRLVSKPQPPALPANPWPVWSSIDSQAPLGRSDMGRSDLGNRPDLSRSDLGRPMLDGRSDLGRPDLGRPDLGRPDLGRPDLGSRGEYCPLGCDAGDYRRGDYLRLDYNTSSPAAGRVDCATSPLLDQGAGLRKQRGLRELVLRLFWLPVVCHSSYDLAIFFAAQIMHRMSDQEGDGGIQGFLLLLCTAIFAAAYLVAVGTFLIRWNSLGSSQATSLPRLHRYLDNSLL